MTTLAVDLRSVQRPWISATLVAIVGLAAGKFSLAEPTGATRLDAMVRPFLVKYCFECHGSERSEADVRLDLLIAGELRSGAEVWPTVLDRVSSGTMPPEEASQPSSAEVHKFVQAIQSALGVEISVGQLPGAGNYVDHDVLFREPAVRKAASPSRLWRINAHVFKEQVNARSHRPLLQVLYNQGADGMHPSVPFLTPQHTFRDYASVHQFENATTELLMDMMWRVAGHQIENVQSSNKLRRPLATDSPNDEDYATAIRAQFEIVAQREPQPAELDRLVALARQTESAGGVRLGLQTALTAVLLSPESVFRFEIGTGPADEHGRYRLSDREIAVAISYALTDNLPDATLRAALESGALSSRDGVLAQVNRMLDDAELPKPRILRFFQEYFEYTRAPNVFKSGRRIKHFMPLQMALDADSLVLHVLAEDRDVLKQLLTTNKFFVNYEAPGKKKVNRPDKRQNHYYELYNLPFDWEWQADQPITLPAQQRSGLLTHPAWLLSFSANDHNQPIQRGRWIQTKLLGGTVPDVPITVDAQLPADETLTLRERMHVTRQEYCWRCHQRMDPLGLTLEQFDDFGQYRTAELEEPVDTTGAVKLQGAEYSVQDPFELMQRLAESRHVQQVFVRHAFRFWMGRDEAPDDAPTLIDAENAYMESGGSMRALVASLLTSDSFLLRRIQSATTAAN